MFDWRRKSRALPLAALTSGVVVLATAGSGAAGASSCDAFKTQAQAQDEFIAAGGSPQRGIGGMDPDRDGVACEELRAPYKGYATIDYNRKRNFIYGTATMPAPSSGGEPACLSGNRFGPVGPRRVSIFRALPDGDKPISDRLYGAEARPASARLVWKAEVADLAPGHYYAAFEERIRIKPYGPNQCPSFSSRPQLLPPPRR